MTLPPDLSRLGDHLEQAARGELRRRRRAWALRTAALGATLACLSAWLSPQSLSPAERAATESTIASAQQSRCTEPQSMRRQPCSDPPPLMTDAAGGRESLSVVAHLGDAAQSGPRRVTQRGDGGLALF